MASVSKLSQSDYARYKEQSCYNQDRLILDYSVQYHDGDIVSVRILDADEGVVGLVQAGMEPYTVQKNDGWISDEENAYELICDAISNHDNELVRCALTDTGFAKNIEIASINAKKETPAHILEKLAHDESPIVRSSVAFHPNLPYAAFKVLVEDQDTSVRLAAAESANIAERNLETLSNDPDESVRAAVASNPLASLSCLQRLSCDTSEKVLEHLSENPSISQDVAKKLAKYKSGVIKRNIAKNPATNRTVLEFLLEESECFEHELRERDHQSEFKGMSSDSFHSSLLRSNIASNPNTPPDILIELAKTAHLEREDVRLNLVNNPNSPREAIEIIADNTVGAVASSGNWPKALLDCPLLPVAYFERIAQTTSVAIRCLVRDHPRTPPKLKELLSHDSSLSKIQLDIDESDIYDEDIPF